MMNVSGGLPKLVLQVDFTGDNLEELQEKVKLLKEKLAPLHPKTRVALEHEEDKYWAIRRESFSLLKNKIHTMHTAPFIDDFIIDPKYLVEFLPKLDVILRKYPTIIYTIAGHVGNGNFHIIPLMNLSKKSEHHIVPDLSREVFDLVLSYNGSISGEHNDGIVRTPYLADMYGKKIVALFDEVKNIFDPKGIFNPGKKTHGSLSYGMDHIRTNWE
jgi:FAD/FMN-containing dehydrogenase